MKIKIAQWKSQFFKIRFLISSVIRLILINQNNLLIKAIFTRGFNIVYQKLGRQDLKVILNNLSQKKETKASISGEKLKIIKLKNKVTKIRFKSHCKIRKLKVMNNLIKMIIKNLIIIMKAKNH